jgi:hypothetical protein
MDALLFIIYMIVLLGFLCAAGALAWVLEKVALVIDLGGQETRE